jgi:hypothetical protein
VNARFLAPSSKQRGFMNRVAIGRSFFPSELARQPSSRRRPRGGRVGGGAFSRTWPMSSERWRSGSEVREGGGERRAVTPNPSPPRFAPSPLCLCPEGRSS